MNNSNNKCNNSNSNDSNNNEKLFWLIFHNKFLLNKIINHIQTEEWIKYNDHSQLHINNRLKFKNIHSLSLMLKNKLYSLLEYKLNNNEYIEINKESITTLFNELSINNIIKNNNNNTNNKLKEILINLLNKKRNEFEIMDLTFEAVKFNSLEVLRILINKPYSIIIYPSTLEYAIQNSNPLIVDEILNSSGNGNGIDYILKKECICKLILKNEKYKLDMMKCILLNFNKLNSTNNTTTTAFISYLDKNKKPLNITLPLSSSLISIILSTQSQSQSLIISCFKEDPIYIFQLLNLKELINLSIDITFSIFSILYYNEISIDKSIDINNSNLSLKQLQKLIIIKLNQLKSFEIKNNLKIKEIYKSYIYKYKETISECHNLSLSSNLEINTTNTTTNEKDTHQIYEFLRIIELLNEDEQDDDDIKNSQQDILNDLINGSLEWNQLLFDLAFKCNGNEKGKMIVINDKSTIDWILNCKNKSILLFIEKNFYKLTFSTLELTSYVHKEIKLVNFIYGIGDGDGDDEELLSKSKFIYHYEWYKGILDYDFIKLMYIESQSIGTVIHHTISNLIYNKLSNNHIIFLINYFNTNGFNKFDEIGLNLFLEQLIKSFGGLHSEIFSNIELNFAIIDNNHFEKLIEPILKKSIIEIDLNRVNLILNSNLFKNNYFNEIIDNLKFYNYFNNSNKIFKYNGLDGDGDGHCKILFYKEKQGSSRIEIIEIIKKLLLINSSSSNGDGGVINQYCPISVMINYFFKKLIQIKGIKMEKVKEIYKLIQNNSIKINHSPFHSFYYLNIKDVKFTFYLTSSHFIKILFQGRIGNYKCRDLQVYFNSLDFTFKSINNLSFDKILQMLIDHINASLICKYHNKFKELDYKNYMIHINKELEYYLIIRRIDLFFKK